ncbi:hypothetical protein FBEOM_2484 [Fusarium beomiforme]|uniref:F-box domain-containing protein n=1 Tax=Fusarium beomiforme TaxID=44412 RepID=A0A9P5ARE6_9HYPO|nr:hypothetical protein FBEOM_2484 [Fusarium beomiforme]
MAGNLPPKFKSLLPFNLDNVDRTRLIDSIGYLLTDNNIPGAIFHPCKDPTPVHESLLMPFVNPKRKVRPPDAFLRLLPQLVDRILSLCDVETIFELRQTTSQFRDYISNFAPYQSVILCALPLYHAILGTIYARNLPFGKFWRKLCTMSCEYCGAFAMLIDIPYWTRICCHCVEEGKGTRYVQLSTVKTWLPEGQPIPLGVYLHTVGLKGWRQSLVAYYKVRHLDVDHDRPVTRPFNYFSQANYMVTCAAPVLVPRTGDIEKGIACKGCMGLRPQARLGCRRLDRRVYTNKDFLEHFRWCDRAQWLWKAYLQGFSPLEVGTTDLNTIQMSILLARRRG